MREALRARRMRKEAGASLAPKSAFSWGEERALWEDLIYKHGVLVTPGEIHTASLVLVAG